MPVLETDIGVIIKFLIHYRYNIKCYTWIVSFTPHNSPMSAGNYYSHFTDEVHRGLNANTIQVHKY